MGEGRLALGGFPSGDVALATSMWTMGSARLRGAEYAVEKHVLSRWGALPAGLTVRQGAGFFSVNYENYMSARRAF